MNILGVILVLVGLFVNIYISTETRIDMFGSFGSSVFFIMFDIITFGIGGALIKYNGNSDDNNK